MSNETFSRLSETILDRDAYIHRPELLRIAHTVVLEERSELGSIIVRSFDQREYLYLMIDTAAEKGYKIDNLEAITLLEDARDALHQADARESNIRDGTVEEDIHGIH